MAIRSKNDIDRGRAIAWLEHHDEIVRAADIVASFAEHSMATVDELHAATATLRSTNTDLELHLASRMHVS